MFKLIGSGLFLAAGAGALYYWWSREHAGEPHEMSDRLQAKSRELKTKAQREG